VTPLITAINAQQRFIPYTVTLFPHEKYRDF
jgi:hypothetical protein